MMDELRVKLSTNFMKRMVSKLLSRAIFKKTGYKVNIQINDFDFWSIDGDTTIKANVEIKLNNEEFKKIIKSIETE